MKTQKNAKPTTLRPQLSVEIAPTFYDRLSAAVVAGILLLGFMLLVLFSIWWNPEVAHHPVGDDTIIVPPPPLNPDLTTLDDKGFLEPGVQEFPELEIPQMAQLLIATTDAVSKVVGVSEANIGTDTKVGRGLFSFGHDRDVYKVNEMPVQQRWSVKFQAENIDDYKKQLSFFDIDVAAIHRTKNLIWRVSDVADSCVVTQTSRQQENQTLRFHHKKSRMRSWDVELCKQSGVEMSDTIVSHFYPAATQEMLKNLESTAVAKAGRKLEEVRKTFFKVVKQDDGFEFKVALLQYR